MTRKIKVLDVIPEVNENTPINADVEAVNEPEQVIETEVKSDEKVEELPKEQIKEETIETDVKSDENETKPQETKQIKKQELHQCPKCQKWLTKKTLTYFHECTKNDTVKAKRRPKKEVIVKDIEPQAPPPSPKPSPIPERTPSPKPPPQPKLVRQVNHYTPPVEVSYEDMRKERIKQRIQQRTVKIQNLFANAI